MARSGARWAGWAAAWLARWGRRHLRWLAGWVIAGCLVWLTTQPGQRPAAVAWIAVLAVGPGIIGCVWQGLWPVAYERVVAGPARRLGWRWWCRRRWASLARTSGLSTQATVRVRRSDGQRVEEQHWVAPRLARLRVRGDVIELTIRARPGQMVEEVEQAAPRLASTLAATSSRTRPVEGGMAGCAVVVELVMRDALCTPAIATTPPRAAGHPTAGLIESGNATRSAQALSCDRVRLGRGEAGREWWLQLRGRHTLIAGCSGAGKGSVLWGICCGLAAEVAADVVRLWGVDLKRGVELAMGSRLFCAHAYTPDDALAVLRALMRVIDDRGRTMAGRTRLHQPRPGDPLHVLVIDELAALTAYADPTIRREAERLLAEVLTQGRALGVVVVACVQDPRKDVVSMRGLFTQTIALRLRSPEETAMVLGEGMFKVAAAHRISPAQPGTAWVVDDTGAADRVRADYWTDQTIQATAALHPTRAQANLTPDDHGAQNENNAEDPGRGGDDLAARREADVRARKPRSPRAPRQPRIEPANGTGAADRPA